MNKFHVVLLSVLASVALNACAGDAESWISKETKNKLIILGTDGAVYNYAPDVVGLAKSAGNVITPACIKNKLYVPALITNITNKLPNAVNSQNANRVLTTGLVYGLSKFCEFRGQYDLKEYSVDGAVVLSCNPTIIKDGAKAAVNSMKDATVAIAVIEALSSIANKLGGERAEAIAANYASWINRAKTVGFAVAKQVSKAYTWEVFSTEAK